MSHSQIRRPGSKEYHGGHDGAEGYAPPAPEIVEAGIDLSHSPLWNPDLAPTAPSQRTWTTYNIAALWIGMSVVITTYTLASGIMQQGMTWWQAMLTILLGNVIVLVPDGAQRARRHEVRRVVSRCSCRAAFGVKGANVPAMLRAIVACGWFGIQTWIGGLALHELLTAAWPGWARVPGNIWIAFFALLADAGGHHPARPRRHQACWRAGRHRCCLAAARPACGGRSTPAAAWAASSSESTRLQQAQTPFWALFPAALTANVGYWATLSLNIPDFTRYARSQRSQVLGQAIGLPTTMTAFAFIGVAVTSATIVDLRRGDLGSGRS